MKICSEIPHYFRTPEHSRWNNRSLPIILGARHLQCSLLLLLRHPVIYKSSVFVTWSRAIFPSSSENDGAARSAFFIDGRFRKIKPEIPISNR